MEGRDLAILSKKLATIITDVPVEFHEEEFKVKDWNKEALKEIFGELEFRTLAKRLLGEEVEAAGSAAPSGDKKPAGKSLQIDLFGNVIGGEEEVQPAPATEAGDDAPSFSTLKKLADVPHEYAAITGMDAINNMVQQLSSFDEICFDTETTNIDANLAELVGMSFSVKPGEAYWVPCPADRIETDSILAAFQPLFEDESKTWIGQNLKYDLLVMKWYGVEFKGKLFDTMLAHYVIEPDGKRSMDQLSAKYLGYEPIPIDELIGKKGKTQGTMRDVELEKITDYAAEDADITLQLKEVFTPLLAKKKCNGFLAKWRTRY